MKLQENQPKVLICPSIPNLRSFNIIQFEACNKGDREMNQHVSSTRVARINAKEVIGPPVQRKIQCYFSSVKV